MRVILNYIDLFIFQTIEHLNTNVNLESLDLSENNITHITDLSHLKNLKVILHFKMCFF